MTHSFPKYIQLFLFCFLFLSLKYTIVYACPSSGENVQLFSYCFLFPSLKYTVMHCLPVSFLRFSDNRHFIK